MVGLRLFSSISADHVVPLRGDWAIFCHSGSGRVGRVWSTREKSLEILRHGQELNPAQGEDGQWDPFIFPLSYHDWRPINANVKSIVAKYFQVECFVLNRLPADYSVTQVTSVNWLRLSAKFT